MPLNLRMHKILKEYFQTGWNTEATIYIITSWNAQILAVHVSYHEREANSSWIPTYLVLG
uniref:Uncharacterized protein n=1 Tax=Nelumbo nucifera TaxID=4432 RepID=A0A822XKB5_NELNU|nr:TPA_asm: hypothetical protein HUJ06_022263 [Nelumbo nucifera]